MNTFNEWQVGYHYKVFVTHVNDPKSFFVRMAASSDLMNIIERPSSDPVSASTITSGLRVVYKSKSLKKFVRGQIHYIKTDKGKVKCDIYAIDYGCFDKSVSARHIHTLDSSAEPQNQCPGLATHCQLYLCEPRGGEVFSEEVIDTMRQLVDKQYAAINVINNISDQLMVELMNAVVPRDVADFLAMMELTVMTKQMGPKIKGAHSLFAQVEQAAHSLSALNLTQTLKYKHKQLNVGDELDVRVQTGTVSGFYVAEVNDLKILKSAAPSFSEYVKNQHMKSEDFVPGRICAVKLDNFDQYERAKIKKVNPNSTAVLELVDRGKDIESNFSSIRSIDNDTFLTLPIIAIYCDLTSDTEFWSPSLLEKLKIKCTVQIEILELGNNSDKPHKVTITKMMKDYDRIV